MKRLLPLLLVAGLVLSASSCSKEDISWHAIADTFPDSIENKAIRVANCESRLQYDVVSPGGGNWGLFQINRPSWERTVNNMGYSWNQTLDPYINAKIALHIYYAAGGSWQPWGCRHA